MQEPGSVNDSGVFRVSEPSTVEVAASATGASKAGADQTTGGSEPKVRSRSGVGQSRSHGLAWPVLLGCLLIAATALLIRIDAPDVVHAGEARTIATAVHTWQRLAGDDRPAHFSLAWFTPYLNGLEYHDTPPGATWAQLAGYAVFEQFGSATTIDHWVLRSRLIAAGMAMLALAGVFWAGYAIGSLKTGAFAALVCAANPIFIYDGRTADMPIFHAAWAMLSIAAAIWAIRPLRPAPSVERQFLGWLICGLMFGAALLTAGSPALLTVPGPIMLILFLCPGRVSHLLGLMAATLIGLLLAFPWGLYAHEHDPQAWRQWLGALAQPEGLGLAELAGRTGWRLVIALVATAPWTLWIFGAMVQPFSASSQGSRTRMFIGWSWFAYITLIYLGAPDHAHATGADQTAAYASGQTGVLSSLVLLMIAAASVLIGQLFRQYSDLAGEGRFPRLWRWLRWPHLTVLAGASLLMPVLVYGQDWLTQQQWLDGPWFAPTPLWYAFGLTTTLLLLVALSVQWIRQEYPGRVLACWAVWAVGLIASAAPPLFAGPRYVSQAREGVRQIEFLAANRPTYWLLGPGETYQNTPPDPLYLLYAARPLPVIAQDEIPLAARQHPLFYLVAPPHTPALPTTPNPASDPTQSLGQLSPIARLANPAGEPLVVYRYDAREQAPAK